MPCKTARGSGSPTPQTNGRRGRGASGCAAAHPSRADRAMTDERSQELLEFPQIRARLAAHTAFGPSRRLAETLSPSSDPVVVARQLDETDEARDFLGQ